MSIKAQDLRRARGDMVIQQTALFESVLLQCFQKIQRVHSQSSAQYTFFCIPLAISGEPMYEWLGCVSHVKKALRENGFSVRLFRDKRTLLISWDEAPASQDRVETRGESPAEEKAAEPEDAGELVINFDPRDPLSHLNLRAQLMAANGKYAHLKNVQTLRNVQPAKRS